METTAYRYKPTKAFKKTSKLVKAQDLAIIQGGQGAGKTISILMLLIDYVYRNKVEVTICSAELSKLKGTAINDFVKILKDYNIFSAKDWNRSEFIYRFESGGFIEFIGLDKSDVGKGRRREIIFINEANKITLDKFTDITARGQKIIVDFNPDGRFFIHDLATKENLITLTYLDNEYIPIKERENIENYYNLGYNEDGSIKNEYYANKWRVYGLGEIGSVEGRIFYWEKISDKSFNEIQSEVYYGVDWGAVDPFAVVEVKYNDGNLYVHEINYEPENSIIKNMLPQTYKEIKARDDEGLVSYLFNKWSLPKDKHYVCDNNRKGKILALRNAGYELAMGVGAKSKILDRVGYMSQMNIYYTESSKNIEFEQQNYCYSKDRHGNTNEQPDDVNNHTIDAISYAITFLISRGIIKNL